MNNDIELKVKIIEDLNLSYLVQATVAKVTKTFWLPKSQIALIDRDGDTATAIMPQWLAEKKGL